LRARTEDRRLAIIDAARSVFQDMGYERASMSEIARRLGGSKATLYGYYPSKEDLFIATVHHDIETRTSDVLAGVRAAPNLRAALTHFAENYLRLALDPHTLNLFRMVGAQPIESGIGKAFFQDGLMARRRRMADFLKEAMDRGELRQADPWTAINHLKGMAEADLLEGAMLSAELPAGEARRKKAAHDAVDAFLRAYAP
jgi:AcrR family transcriptional regulator